METKKPQGARSLAKAKRKSTTGPELLSRMGMSDPALLETLFNVMKAAPGRLRAVPSEFYARLKADRKNLYLSADDELTLKELVNMRGNHQGIVFNQGAWTLSIWKGEPLSLTPAQVGMNDESLLALALATVQDGSLTNEALYTAVEKRMREFSGNVVLDPAGKQHVSTVLKEAGAKAGLTLDKSTWKLKAEPAAEG